MTSETSQTPSTPEVITALFHKPGESDYHYLKMDNCNFWAGPSYWKRPQGHNIAENKKKLIRKKREPVEIVYTKTDAEIKAKDAAAEASKKAAVLSKKTLARWSMKKVTCPQDIHFEPETFHLLFTMDIYAEVTHQNFGQPEEVNPTVEEEPPQSEEDNNAPGDDFHHSPDMFESDGSSDSEGSGFRGFGSPDSSPLNSQNGFRGFPSPGSSSPFDPERGFRGFDSEEVDTEEIELANPNAADQEEGQPSCSCDVYEGENLVPMVKTVKVDPIRIVAKPNRVDMQHLKLVMLSIIRRAIEDRENVLRGEGLQSPRGSVAFRDVLTQLYSSELIHNRTREDLTVQMAFLCLLTITNENNFSLEKDESDDFQIMYDPRDDPSMS